jgi:hypothetical protein
MTLEDLIAQFRVDSEDAVEPYLSSDAAATSWLNEAEQEAAIRARLIHDVTTPAVCTIAVTAGTTVYPLHTAVFEVTRAVFTPVDTTTEYDLYLTDRVEQDRSHPGWRTRTDTPREVIQTDTTLQLGCIPSTDGTISLEAYRLPLKNIEDQSSESPEIGRIHHRHLVQWALHRCYSRPDADVHDPDRSAIAQAEFTRVFGIRPDADQRRFTQANRPTSNKACW